jgi:hypothetical protein
VDSYGLLRGGSEDRPEEHRVFRDAHQTGVRDSGVDVGDGAAGVQFGPQGVEARVVQRLSPGRAAHPDPVKAEFVQAAHRLGRGFLRMRQRHRAERAQPARALGRELGVQVVGESGALDGGRAVRPVGLHSAQPQDLHVDAGGVQIGDPA